MGPIPIVSSHCLPVIIFNGDSGSLAPPASFVCPNNHCCVMAYSTTVMANYLPLRTGKSLKLPHPIKTPFSELLMRSDTRQHEPINVLTFVSLSLALCLSHRSHYGFNRPFSQYFSEFTVCPPYPIQFSLWNDIVGLLVPVFLLTFVKWDGVSETRI